MYVSLLYRCHQRPEEGGLTGGYELSDMGAVKDQSSGRAAHAFRPSSPQPWALLPNHTLEVLEVVIVLNVSLYWFLDY